MAGPKIWRNFAFIGKNKFAEKTFIKGNNTPIITLTHAFSLILRMPDIYINKNP